MDSSIISPPVRRSERGRFRGSSTRRSSSSFRCLSSQGRRRNRIEVSASRGADFVRLEAVLRERDHAVPGHSLAATRANHLVARSPGRVPARACSRTQTRSSRRRPSPRCRPGRSCRCAASRAEWLFSTRPKIRPSLRSLSSSIETAPILCDRFRAPPIGRAWLTCATPQLFAAWPTRFAEAVSSPATNCSRRRLVLWRSSDGGQTWEVGQTGQVSLTATTARRHALGIPVPIPAGDGHAVQLCPGRAPTQPLASKVPLLPGGCRRGGVPAARAFSQEDRVGNERAVRPPSGRWSRSLRWRAGHRQRRLRTPRLWTERTGECAFSPLAEVFGKARGIERSFTRRPTCSQVPSRWT